MPTIETVWNRIAGHAGETFHQVRGGTFLYEVQGNAIIPSRTNYNISKGEFEKALARVPLDGPGEIQDVRGPSYVYAILMDQRVRGDDW